MGASEDVEGYQGDASVGTIVWVRRRNGSWWPGRILGVDETSISHITSPKTGTPVKLLGRDDASVDWYNLEKSKRVKPFRCGEFDDCIEKVESSHGFPIKKREKYARREDAILHALELERELLEKNKPKPSSANSNRKMQMVLRKNSGSSGKSGLNLKSQSISKRVKDHTATKGKRQGCEDVNFEAIPQKGCKDFGPRTASSKRKTSPSILSDDLQRPSPLDNQVHILSDHDGNVKDPSGIKRQRTQGGLHEDTYVRRGDRRNPLAKVIQNSAKFLKSHSLPLDDDFEKEKTGVIVPAKRNRSRCVYLPTESNNEVASDPMQISSSPQVGTDNGLLPSGSLTEENTSSGLVEEDDYFQKDSLDTNVNEEKGVPSDSTPSPPLAVSINALRSLNNSRVLRRPEIMNSEELNALNQNGDGAVDASVSKWQLKGKRNVRPLMKKPMEGDEINRFSNGAIGRSSVQWDPVGEDFDEDSDEDSLSESDGLPPTVRTPSVSKRCWSSDYSRRNFKSELFDVVLTVQKTYQGEHQLHRKTHQGEHVPLVSLMSRLNGKAIIGHPIQIEKLEDGFSSNLVRIRNDLAPVWRTGRRTTVPRVPRPHPSTTYHGDDPPYHYESNSHRWRLPGNKSPKKPIKRASLWNQKTKSLSSIRPRSPKHVKNFDDLIRPNAGPTIVTCIPVKLVFSRLLEAVGRPPSR